MCKVDDTNIINDWMNGTPISRPMLLGLLIFDKRSRLSCDGPDLTSLVFLREGRILTCF